MDLKEFINEYIKEDPVKLTKDLYSEAYKTRYFKCKKSQVLTDLIVDGFDTEQIWQQIELENNELFGPAGLETLTRALVNKNSQSSTIDEKQKSNASDNKAEHQEEEGEELEEESELGESEDDTVQENAKRKAKQISSSTKKRQKTEVDDKFFSLREMDDYVTKVEKQEMSSKKQKSSEKSLDDDDDEDIDEDTMIDYFDDIPDDENDDIKYEDFFDSPDGENEKRDFDYTNENDKESDDGDNRDNRKNVNDDDDDENGEEDDDDDNEDYDDDDDDDNGDDGDDNEHRFNDEDNSDDVQHQEKGKQKKVKFNLLDGSDGSDSEKEDKDQDDRNQNKSSFETREERLKKKIENLEKEAISEKPWQMKGEATAHTRPKDSLLEEFVEFDVGMRPAPVMTEKVMEKLEDIIRRRIKDKAWDDVEKKFKPVETPLEYKKKLVMNQEKSKESLAQIYENEYIKQREALIGGDKDEQDKEETPEEIEIRERMHSLFNKLDALSNFHYTPKLAKPEIKIVSNVPAINMEEVAPVATSDATLLAPEEIKGKPKSDLLGKSERTKTDKKRERRKKKLKQHKRAVYQSQKEAEQQQNQNKNKKNSKLNSTKITGRNIIKDADISNQKAVKSSTAFFSQLQNEVTTGIKEKLSVIKSKQKKNELSAAKLKL